MLRFFSQIRQRLLTDNKVSKYLLYAVGEILLVVIGILIALQVDNWNETRKDRKRGHNYLERIQTDVQKDAAILNHKSNLANLLSNQYLDMIAEMHKTQVNKEDFIRLMNSSELNVDELILTDVAYSELVNTGNMSLILNSVLKDQISEYYRSYEFVSARVRELNQSNLNTVHAANVASPNLKYWVKGYLDNLPEEIFNEQEYMYHDSDWAFINNPRSIEFRLLEDAVYYYYMKQIILKPMYKDLNNQAVALIESIGMELNAPEAGN
jgi:hypothetical protein